MVAPNTGPTVTIRSLFGPFLTYLKTCRNPSELSVRYVFRIPENCSQSERFRHVVPDGFRFVFFGIHLVHFQAGIGMFIRYADFHPKTYRTPAESILKDIHKCAE